MMTNLVFAELRLGNYSNLQSNVDVVFFLGRVIRKYDKVLGLSQRSGRLQAFLRHDITGHCIHSS